MDLYGRLEELQGISARSDSANRGYAREELVAELGAAFLCAELGITLEVRQDHADYPGHWLTVLKEDKRGIFSAAADAQRAADYLTGLQQTHVSAAPERAEGAGPRAPCSFPPGWGSARPPGVTKSFLSYLRAPDSSRRQASLYQMMQEHGQLVTRRR